MPALSPRPRRLAAASVALAAALCLAAPSAGALAATSAPRSVFALSAPTSLATVDGTLFVANKTTGTITLVNATTGAFEGLVSHKVLGLSAPSAMAASTGRTWHTVLVASAGGANRAFAVTKTKSGVSLKAIGTVGLANCARGAAVSLTTGAAGQFVALCSNGAIDELSATTGHLVRALAPAVTGLAGATALSVVGGAAFVTVSAARPSPAPAAVAKEGVVEVALSNGKRLGAITNATCSSCGFEGPDGIAYSGGQLWVADSLNDQATQLSTGPLAFLGTQTSNLYGTGAVVATSTAVYLASVNGPTSSMVTMFTTKPGTYQWMMCNTNGPYKFDNPSAMAIAATGTVLHPRVLWVANPADNLLDEMDATTGALLTTVA